MWLLRTITFFVLTWSTLGSPSKQVTTLTLAKRNGYNIEEHDVETSDGYILTMHRIPHGKNSKYAKGRPVVFLMHGLLCSSAIWTYGDANIGLAYILAEAGYDVWMGNARGNTYSRKHKTLRPTLKKFWEFSWHEIALYDLPAMMKYALNRTHRDNLQYVGYSQGTTTFFVLASLDENLKNVVRSAHLLAPIAWMKHTKSPLPIIGAALMGQPSLYTDLFGSAEFLPSLRANALIVKFFCKNVMLSTDVCTNTFFLFGGWNSPYLNESLLPDILATTPAGTSVMTIKHYIQECVSGYFRQRDLGSDMNFIKYSKADPPNYDVHKIDVPHYIYYSDNDNMASLFDVDILVSKLNPNYLKRLYRLPLKQWNHLDFLISNNVKKLLYDTLIADMANA